MATVSRRSWTTRHGEKRSAWVVSYYDHGGNQHRLQFKTKRQAEDERVRVEGELAGGVHVADRDSVTVLVAAHAFLADFEGLVRVGKRERSTLDSYRRHIALHIAPFAIAGIKLSRLTGPVCLAYARDLEGARTSAMAKRALSTLRTILDFATSHGWCRANPAKSVQIRTAIREDVADAEEADNRFPAKDEMRSLLRAADQREDRGMAAAFVRVLCFCGLRASEIRALRRQDLDFARNRVHVRQRADAWQRIGPCKSRSGRRAIPLPPDTAAAVKRWVLAAPLSEFDLVFPTSIGTVQSYANLYHRIWVPLMVAAELVERSGEVVRPNFALHALRHVACSLWIELGANAKQVQTWAGHASVQFTLDRYGHIWEGSVSDSNIAAKIERSVGD